MIRQTEIERHKAITTRYGETTFVVLGRTHASSIINDVIKSRQRNPWERSPGYIGESCKKKDKYGRISHEILRLDFTPTYLQYLQNWKSIFAIKGFMVACMYLPP